MVKVVSPEPQSAADYDNRTTTAVKAVLLEIGQILGSFQGKFAVIGGAVPWLLLESQEMRHVGTIDVDLSLNPEALGDGEYAKLVEVLMSNGYRQRQDLLLVIMAGGFRQDNDPTKGNRFPKQDPEFNLAADIPSAQTLFANWPTPIVASGVEVGLAMRYPTESILNDYGYVQDHPIAQTYRLFYEERKAKHPSITGPCPHPTFDLTAVLYAARPNRNYFSLSSPGRITVLDDGSSHFEEAQGGRDQYLILSEEQKARTLEAMVLLTSQPPRALR